MANPSRIQRVRSAANQKQMMQRPSQPDGLLPDIKRRKSSNEKPALKPKRSKERPDKNDAKPATAPKHDIPRFIKPKGVLPPKPKEPTKDSIETSQIAPASLRNDESLLNSLDNLSSKNRNPIPSFLDSNSQASLPTDKIETTKPIEMPLARAQT